VGSTLGGTGLAISTKCEHRDVALAYALWLAGKHCQQTLYVESGGQPASKTAWLDDFANRITNGYFRATLPVLENAWLRPRFAGFERFQVAAAEMVAEYLKTQSSSPNTLARLNELFARTRPE
jgi:multiple sugar transport system substrate-binding protein